MIIIANPDQISNIFHSILLKFVLIFIFTLAFQEITTTLSNQIVSNEALNFNSGNIGGTFKRASQSMFKIFSCNLIISDS